MYYIVTSRWWLSETKNTKNSPSLKDATMDFCPPRVAPPRFSWSNVAQIASPWLSLVEFGQGRNDRKTCQKCQSNYLKKIWMFPKIGGFPPKSSILIGLSIVNHPFWGTPIFGNTHIVTRRMVHHEHVESSPSPTEGFEICGWQSSSLQSSFLNKKKYGCSSFIYANKKKLIGFLFGF